MFSTHWACLSSRISAEIHPVFCQFATNACFPNYEELPVVSFSFIWKDKNNMQNLVTKKMQPILLGELYFDILWDCEGHANHVTSQWWNFWQIQSRRMCSMWCVHVYFDQRVWTYQFWLFNPARRVSFREGHARNHRYILTSSNKWHDLIGETYSCSPVFFQRTLPLKLTTLLEKDECWYVHSQ